MADGTLEGTREPSVRVAWSYIPSTAGRVRKVLSSCLALAMPMPMPSHEEKEEVNRGRRKKARYTDTTSESQNATTEKKLNLSECYHGK